MPASLGRDARSDAISRFCQVQARRLKESYAVALPDFFYVGLLECVLFLIVIGAQPQAETQCGANMFFRFGLGGGKPSQPFLTLAINFLRNSTASRCSLAAATVDTLRLALGLSRPQPPMPNTRSAMI
jgi:hypothetical protein